MSLQTKFTLALLTTLSAVGCAYSLRIPLSEDPAAVFIDAAHVVIVDARPSREHKTHLGKDIWSCERWFGDDSFQPGKLVYLDALIAERTPAKTPVQIRLDRFETVEYCQNSGNSGGSAAARNAGTRGLPAFEAGAVMGDTVRLRLAGTVNGVPFDVSRTFDFGFLEYTFPKTPSSNYIYRALLRDRLEQMADEIVKLISKS